MAAVHILAGSAVAEKVDGESGSARIHYHRPDENYAGWGLHVWENTTEQVAWDRPLAPAGRDAFGLYWNVHLTTGAKKVGFIVHRGDIKDPGADMFLVLAEHGREVWFASGNANIYGRAPDLAALPAGDLARRRAHWVDRRTIAWKVEERPGSVYRLHFAPEGGLAATASGIAGGEALDLHVDPSGLPAAVRANFPHLSGDAALRLSEADAGRASDLLRGQLAVSVRDASGRVLDATGVQIPGVLDDLFAYDGPLGVSWEGGLPVLRLWAPTARSVRLLLFDSADGAPTSVAMTREGGVWSAVGRADWRGKYYLYEVEVFVPEIGRIERNRVTDPYSRSLSMNSMRSQIVDLEDPALQPEGWKALGKPRLEAPEDIVVYELHVRDFSAGDPTVPEAYRGTYMAFTVESNGTRHLRALAEAGLTHVHLLPVFDFATVDEDRSTWQDPGDLGGYPANSEAQQASIARIRDRDGYNWGYDPYHYGVPEGSYSTEPDGPRRILEFRRMVQALAGMGLRVVLDVVYNHTHASGQAEKSVLDRIVPGYYHRLDADGLVTTSTCCQNTATEHRMMEKLMVDDLVHWARDYKVDGFRFDLMGHHMKRNIEAARDALQALRLERDGVDGPAIYLYGEGWDFGEVAHGARGANATQPNMAGTGVGTFNDRLRDAARGGNPFGDRRAQGFLTGLYYDPNGFDTGGEVERGRLLEQQDRIRIGLAGNLRDYVFRGSTGRPLRGSELPYGGYTADPQEAINYVSSHDNETLFDKIQFAASAGATLEDRVRMQCLGLALVALGQGVPFFQAGDDMLRSKSFDADSHDSGDWFNGLDFSYASNNFGVGLPPADKNRERWDLMRPLLARADLKPGRREILAALAQGREVLHIRRSSRLFRLRTAAEVQARLRFHGTGPDQVPGLVVTSLADRVEGWPSIDPLYGRIVVLFNASPKPQVCRDVGWVRGAFALHPVQAQGHDEVVKGARFEPDTGTFTVPARTAAVFVERGKRI